MGYSQVQIQPDPVDLSADRVTIMTYYYDQYVVSMGTNAPLSKANWFKEWTATAIEREFQRKEQEYKKDLFRRKIQVIWSKLTPAQIQAVLDALPAEK